jgi:hypothetical protein
MQDDLEKRNELGEQLEIGPDGILIERPSDSVNPVNGNYDPDDEDETKEEDLILGDEDELNGDEEEFDVELEEDFDEDEIDEDDLVIDVDEDVDEDEEDDL